MNFLVEYGYHKSIWIHLIRFWIFMDPTVLPDKPWGWWYCWVIGYPFRSFSPCPSTFLPLFHLSSFQSKSRPTLRVCPAQCTLCSYFIEPTNRWIESYMEIFVLLQQANTPYLKKFVFAWASKYYMQFWAHELLSLVFSKSGLGW